jgi:hypothetical protein
MSRTVQVLPQGYAVEAEHQNMRQGFQGICFANRQRPPDH